MQANRVEVPTRTGVADDIRRRLLGWWRAKARDCFAKRIDDLSNKLPWIDAPPPFRLRSMTRQWGSCSPGGEIILNPDLVKAPRPGIDYVLIHELAHLKHHDHGPEFWGLIDQHAGDWKPAKLLLDSWVEFVSNW